MNHVVTMAVYMVVTLIAYSIYIFRASSSVYINFPNNPYIIQL